MPKDRNCRVSVAYAIHRPEILALAEPAMREHAAICLEEPPTPGFHEMLAAKMDIGEYLMATDFEFPIFARKSCELLQILHGEGKPIYQVDPYMEALLEVHELFAQGKGPQDLKDGSLLKVVHGCEKQWYAALLGFYGRSMGGNFEDAVEAVKTFGRSDAARGRLRDDLRAQELARIAPEYESVYVEAGYVHTYLLTTLRRRVPEGVEVRPLYLMEDLVKEMDGRRRAMGPGDVLTLTYTYKPDYQGSKADLQAARSLIRIKILHKDEIDENLHEFPHTRDEVMASNLVRGLEYEDCRELYPLVRQATTVEAKRIVEEYVTQAGPCGTRHKDW